MSRYFVIAFVAVVFLWFASFAPAPAKADTIQACAPQTIRGMTCGFQNSGGSYSTISVPGASDTFATGINSNGAIVGTYSTGGCCVNTAGFLDSAGVFSTISLAGSSDTQLLGINDSGQIVGNYYAPNQTNFPYLGGFIYDAGAYTLINVPGATGTFANGINDAGQIAGYYLYDNGTVNLAVSGFLYSGGSYTSINAPGASNTEILGINNTGEMVGGWCSNNTCADFVYSGGTFTTISGPAPDATPAGINDEEQILWNGGSGAFLDSGGTFTPIDVPGSLPGTTGARGINNAGDVVGSYDVSAPEPGALIQSAVGLLLGIAVIAFCRRQTSTTVS
jgi:hypothetical protein